MKKWLISFCLLSVLLFAGCKKEQAEQPEENVVSEETESEAAESEETEAETTEIEAEEQITIDSQLPYMLEDGKLEISSVFQYTGLNVDKNWEDGTDIGAVVLVNRSEEYLKSLDLTLTMSDGTEFQFWIADIPSGGTVWAFDVNNTAYDASSFIADAKTEADFTTDTNPFADMITVTTEEIDVTLINHSSEDLTGLSVRCHSLMDDAYFGGLSYTYPVESIASQETVTFSADDCFVGVAEVVWIDYE